jgi:uncharacterized protein (DUF58 family)
VRTSLIADASIGTVPLLPRYRLLGSSFGGHTSIRRGIGADVAGSRPYQPGDRFHAIDWKASARLSSATGNDEFVVRDRQAEEMPRVVILCDRRPEMALYPPELPWLAKRTACARCVRLLAASALTQRALVGYLDYASHEDGAPGEPFWQPPRSQARTWHRDLVETLAEHLDGPCDAPADTVDRGLHFLGRLQGVITPGSFVFVLSDFLAEVTTETWGALLGRGWDVVPVVIQEPVWEQSFPPIGGVSTTLSDASGGQLLPLRLTRAEAEERRQRNEARRSALLDAFTSVGLDHVDVESDDPVAIYGAFIEWANARLLPSGRLG